MNTINNEASGFPTNFTYVLVSLTGMKMKHTRPLIMERIPTEGEETI